MERVPYSPAQRETWQQLCRTSPDAWFWHTRDWCDYTAVYQATAIAADTSFLVLDGGQPVAVAPCMALVPSAPGGARLTLGNYPVPWPAFHPDLGKKERREAERLAYAGYDELALSRGLASIDSFGVVQARSFFRASFPPANLPLRYGYSGSVFDTHVIDLAAPADELLRDVRKGHRADIKRGARGFRIHRFFQQISDQEFAAYQALHALAAGRVTRAQSTFDDMRRWIREGTGLLVGAERDGQWAGFVYFLVFQKGACYASACNHPEVSATEAVGHALVWEAILACRDAGVELLEMGEQTYDVPGATPEMAKLAAISRFKRGFGGVAAPRYLASKRMAATGST